MKKIFLIIICVLVLAIAATVLLRVNPTQTPPEAETFTDLGTTVTPTAQLETKPASPNSQNTRVTDISKLPEVVDVGDGMYSLNGTRSNPQANFSLIYSSFDNSYSIAILAEPIAENRIEASKYFLELLQTDEATACSLTVYLGTISAVNENISGQNLGLSFCPDAVQL